MFLRANTRKKDGKVHRYWSVVESRRTADDRVLQRQVLYLGEINDSQKAAWTRAIEVFAEAGQARQVAIFPDDRPAPELDCEVVQIRLRELSLHRPRQWGACWLALELWEQLDLALIEFNSLVQIFIKFTLGNVEHADFQTRAGF